MLCIGDKAQNSSAEMMDKTGTIMMTGKVSMFEDTGQEIEKIPVHISYEIIHLFSEGLYKSPHKAIEELVTNGYDANAKQVHILLPESEGDDTNASQSLWVIDDGHGMDKNGFHQLWRIAESEKSDLSTRNGRPVIGQFGIGKLASYVLAWNLTHVSRVNGRFLLTTMNFRDVAERRFSNEQPMSVSLREVDEDTAKGHLAEIEVRGSRRLGVHVRCWQSFMFMDCRCFVRFQGTLSPASDRNSQMGVEYRATATRRFPDVVEWRETKIKQGKPDSSEDGQHRQEVARH